MSVCSDGVRPPTVNLIKRKTVSLSARRPHCTRLQWHRPSVRRANMTAGHNRRQMGQLAWGGDRAQQWRTNSGSQFNIFYLKWHFGSIKRWRTVTECKRFGIDLKERCKVYKGRKLGNRQFKLGLHDHVSQYPYSMKLKHIRCSNLNQHGTLIPNIWQMWVILYFFSKSSSISSSYRAVLFRYRFSCLVRVKFKYDFFIYPFDSHCSLACILHCLLCLYLQLYVISTMDAMTRHEGHNFDLIQ